MRNILLTVLIALVPVNGLFAEWVDVDGAGQESINISSNPAVSWYISLRLDSSDRPRIAWHDYTFAPDIFYLQWNGSAWVDADGVGQESVNVTDNFAGSSEPPSLCLDSAENPHIAWYEGFPAEICYLKWGGTSWVDADGVGQESANVSNTAGASAFPSLGLDNSGLPHVVWEDHDPGYYEIYYLRWDGSSWVDADGVGRESMNISNTTDDSRWPSLCMDNSGNPHVAWQNEGAATGDIYYLKWDGSSWVDADGVGRESINISNTSGACDASLCLDDSGNPSIAWWESDVLSSDVYFLKWNGSSWVDADGAGRESINISNTSNFSYDPSLCLDDTGNPHIAWEDGTTPLTIYNIFYLKWDGNSWVDADGSEQESINVTNSSVTEWRPSLCLDSSGEPHISWENNLGPWEVYYLYWIPPTPTPTATMTSTATVTPTLTISATLTASATFTISPTLTPTVPSVTPTRTVTPTFTFTMTPEPEKIVVYPNPFNPDKAVGRTLKFKGLPEGSKVSIYTVSGELVQELREENGMAYWDGRNKNGAMVSMGSYVYVIRVGKETLKRGRIVVVR